MRNYFFPQRQAEQCSLCETCLELCPMEAITRIGDEILINPNLCIGCGVCAANCPNAILMVKVREGRPDSFESMPRAPDDEVAFKDLFIAIIAGP